jgi:SAM-dependent methyltransferase
VDQDDDRKRYEAPDVFARGLFPVCAATHDLGVRRLFDLSTLLLLLDCRPGDRVLDLGAGPGFATEMLARLGYDTVSVDPDASMLRHARNRVRLDAARIGGRVDAACGVAERLPFPASVFDGVLGMNVLHHVGDLPSALEEMARVLKPGCRAVFCEPGLDHLESAEAQRAIREHGEDDRAFDVMQFLTLARTKGFAEAMLTATLHPPLRLLRIEDVNLYAAGRHPTAHLRPEGVLDELHRRHPYAVLVRDGTRPRTSRHPGVLACTIDVAGLPRVWRRGDGVEVRVRATNTGDTVWLSRPSTRGGFVTVGCKLLDREGALLDDTLGRSFLPRDVVPGTEVDVLARISLPAELLAGDYQLRIDLVDELICWFGDIPGAVAATYRLAVE